MASSSHAVPLLTKLQPHCWTNLPGTNVIVLWDGDRQIIVQQHKGIWNLSPLAAWRGHVLGWIALANHAELGPWPLVPLTVCRGHTYQARTTSVAELARQQGVQPIRSADDLVQPGLFDSDAELDEFLASRGQVAI